MRETDLSTLVVHKLSTLVVHKRQMPGSGRCGGGGGKQAADGKHDESLVFNTYRYPCFVCV